MGLKEDIKLQQERLRVENEIANRVERQTKSMSSYREGVKEVKENAKQIKRLDSDILKIEEAIVKEKLKGKAASKESIKLAEEHKAKLEQQRAQIVATNKELLNAGNLMKAMGNSLISSFKGILPSLSDVINKILELDDITRSTAASIGLSGAGFDAMKASTEVARQSASRWGFELEAGVKLMGSFNEETGRAVILSAEASEKMLQVARATNMSAEEVGTMAGQMEAFGMGAIQASQTIADIQSMSEHMGVNAGKVIKKFQQNLGLLNKMNFRGGMKALAKMAAHSEKFKLSMEAVASVSDKVFRPEGAIEAAARLQTMGGAMAQLGDPFQLMYQARNAPEELAKSLTKAAKESATFNKTTGEFEMSAHELDRLRESADALGMDYTELVKTAKQAAKVDYLDKFLPSGMSEEDKGLITGMTQMTDKGAEITFMDKDGKLQTKLLGELKAEERAGIISRAKTDKERAEQAMSVAKMWTSIQNALMLVAVETLQPLVDWLGSGAGKEWMMGLADGLISFAKGIRDSWPEIKKTMKELWETLKWVGSHWKLILAGAAVAFAAYWIAQQFAAGAMFGMGFRSTSGVGSPVSSGGSGGGLSKLGPGLKSFGASMKNPAMILAIAGALWILADAIEKLASIPWPNLLLATAVLVGLGFGLNLFLNSLGSMGANPMTWLGVALILAVGAAMMMMGAAIYFISAGIALIVDSFTNMFSIINMDNIGAILMLGPALIMASLGIMALATSILFMGVALANPFGLLGLLALGAAAMSLKDAFSGVNADGISAAVDSVNSVNTENIEALKSLSMWLGMMGNSIKIEFGEINVDGEIDLVGQNGAKANSELLNDPIFMRELKRVIAEHTEMDTKGGR